MKPFLRLFTGPHVTHCDSFTPHVTGCFFERMPQYNLNSRHPQTKNIDLWKKRCFLLGKSELKHDFQLPHLVFDLCVDISLILSKSGMVRGSQRHLYCSVGPASGTGVSNYCHLRPGHTCHEFPPFLDSQSSKKSNTLN